jgi:acid stress-induced BolA-like protein IbaG/YrbA
MSKDEKIEVATKKLMMDRDAVKSMLEELVEQDSIHFDGDGHPFWETCGEPLVKGTQLVWE